MFDRIRTAIAFALSISAAVTALAAGPGVASPPPHAPDRVLVAFLPGTPASEVAAAHAAVGARELKRFEAIGVHLVAVPAGSVAASIARYERNPNVRYAEPNFYRPLILPNEGSDPQPPFGLGIEYFGEQWGLHNIGQPLYDPETGASIAGTPDADIDATEAWDLTSGGAGVRIAILDTGIECSHVDLLGKCVEQQNFTASTTAGDVLGHGTHVAGIAAANTNNGVGVAGVGWSALVGSLKVCREYPEFFPVMGLCEVADSVEGLIWAADNGYHVANMSYGSDPDPYTPSQAEAEAVAYAWSKGLVLVAAAGNDYSPKPSYPAAFPEVIAVAATDHHDNLAYFSTFGSWVSVAAPGRNVLSTYPNAACGLASDDPEGCYAWLSGTSMASPHVAGIAALAIAYDPSASNADIRARIEAGADEIGALDQNFGAWVGHGRVNALRTLSAAAPPPDPSGITLSAAGYKIKGLQKADLSWSPATGGSVEVRRDGSVVATVANDGSHTDHIDLKGNGTYTYRVCDLATLSCSNEASVSF